MSPYVKRLKPLAPRKADQRKWRRLVREARAAAAGSGEAGDVVAAAVTARKAVAPDRSLLVEVCVPLIRLAEVWGAMDAATRTANAERLQWLADQLAPHVGVDGTAPPPAAEGRQIEPRKDIYG